MREDEVGLKLGQPLMRDSGLGEEAEAGVDAVDGAARLHDPLHARLRGIDGVEGGGFEGNGRAAPDGAELGLWKKSGIPAFAGMTR